jgi:hypothetical protein
MREILEIINVTQIRVTVGFVALATLLPCSAAHADLNLGGLAGGTGDGDGDPLIGVSAARDAPAVAAWSRKSVWLSRDGADWIRIDAERDLDEVAVSRDGVLHLAAGGRIAVERDGELVWSGSGDGVMSDGWRALVESRRASPSLREPDQLPAFARELGDISIDDEGGAQKLEGDSCPCEGGGQIRELGHVGKMRIDKHWPDDDCKIGSGVGVHGWSYLVPSCWSDAPVPELLARGPDGIERSVRRVPGACEEPRTILLGSDGKRVFGVVGRELLRIEDARATVVGRALPGAEALAVGRAGIFVIRGRALWRWSQKLENWTRVELPEDGC